MRAILVTVLILAACDDNSPVPSDAVVSTLGELDALKASCAAGERAASDAADLRRIIAEQGAEIEALRAAMPKPQKIPHLVAIETGADFGPFAGWDRYYDERIADYLPVDRRSVYYAEVDCKGEARIAPIQGLRFSRDPVTDEVLRAIGPSQPFAAQSRSTGANCANSGDTVGGRLFEGTGIIAPAPLVGDLRIELR